MVHMIAQLTAIFVNTKSKKNSKNYQPDDFVPDWSEGRFPEEDDKPKWKEQLRKVEEINQALGGVDKR